MKVRSEVGAGCQTAPRPVGDFDAGLSPAAGAQVFLEQINDVNY